MDSENKELTPVQQLQLKTGLSASICEDLLKKEGDFDLDDMAEIFCVLEKIPVNLSIPVMKTMFQSQLMMLRTIIG
jgi:hypothetical protein